MHCMQCNAMQCNAMQCNAMQCNAMQCNAMQCIAMQCIAMQCNAMQCNLVGRKRKKSKIYTYSLHLKHAYFVLPIRKVRTAEVNDCRALLKFENSQNIAYLPNNICFSCSYSCSRSRIALHCIASQCNALQCNAMQCNDIFELYNLVGTKRKK